MTKKKIKELLKILDETYGQERCFLDYETPEQLLFATILSAQCTDARVNLVTKDLFKKYPTLSDYANADLKCFEEDIRSTGFYHNKAKNIILSAQKLLQNFQGLVPPTMEELLTLPGVGRKTANIVLGHVFQIPGIAVDTHVKRVSFRLGLTKNTDPDKIEQDLLKALPKEHWIRINTQLITHGRSQCMAQKPICDGCVLGHLCAMKNKEQKKL